MIQPKLFNGEGDRVTLKNEAENACQLGNQAGGYSIIPAVGDKIPTVASSSEEEQRREGGWQTHFRDTLNHNGWLGDWGSERTRVVGEVFRGWRA